MPGFVPVIPFAKGIQDGYNSQPYQVSNAQRKTISIQFLIGKAWPDHITPLMPAETGSKCGQYMNQVNMQNVIEHRYPAIYRKYLSQAPGRHFRQCQKD